MVQAEEVQKRTKCPNCGAKLPEQPLSLCSYCAMPLDLAEGAGKRETKHTARIQKISQHDDYAEAMELTPPESHRWQQGWRMVYRGRVLAVVGLLALGVDRIVGSGTLAMAILAALVILAGVWQVVRGKQLQAQETRLPVLKRPALITDRRSDTTLRGWGGETKYHFTIEFEDGGVGEFGMQGKGVNEEPYTTNLPGVAYTRGETLLHFKHIRV